MAVGGRARKWTVKAYCNGLTANGLIKSNNNPENSKHTVVHTVARDIGLECMYQSTYWQSKPNEAPDIIDITAFNGNGYRRA